MDNQPSTAVDTTARVPIRVVYPDQSDAMRQWLMDLRRDLLRKVKQIDEFILTLETD